MLVSDPRPTCCCYARNARFGASCQECYTTDCTLGLRGSCDAPLADASLVLTCPEGLTAEQRAAIEARILELVPAGVQILGGPASEILVVGDARGIQQLRDAGVDPECVQSAVLDRQEQQASLSFTESLSPEQQQQILESLREQLNLPSIDISSTGGGDNRLVLNVPLSPGVLQQLQQLVLPPGLPPFRNTLAVEGARVVGDDRSIPPLEALCRLPTVSSPAITLEVIMGDTVTVTLSPLPTAPISLFMIEWPGFGAAPPSADYVFQNLVLEYECGSFPGSSLRGNTLSLPTTGRHTGILTLQPGATLSFSTPQPAARKRQEEPRVLRLGLVQWSDDFELFRPAILVDVFSLEPQRVPLPGVMLDLLEGDVVLDQRISDASGLTTFEKPLVHVLRPFTVRSLRMTSEAEGRFATPVEQRAIARPDAQVVRLQVQFDFFGCLAPVLLDAAGSPLSGRRVRFRSGNQTVIGETDAQGRAFARLLPGRWAISIGGVGRGTWTIYSRQCFSASLPLEAAAPSMRVQADAELSFVDGRVTVRPGDTINVDETSSLVSLNLGRGSSVALQDGATLNVEEAISLSNNSVVVGRGSSLNVTRGLNVGQGSSLTVQQGGTISLSELSIEDRTGSVSLGEQSTVRVTGNFSALNGGSLVFLQGSLLEVGGSFNGAGLNVTLDIDAPLCETTTVVLATFSETDNVLPVINYAGGNEGVARLDSTFTGNTLSVAITPRSSDPKLECPISVNASNNPLENWQMALIALGIIIVGVAGFAVFVQRSHAAELEARNVRLKQVVAQKREENVMQRRRDAHADAQQLNAANADATTELVPQDSPRALESGDEMEPDSDVSASTTAYSASAPATSSVTE